MGFAATREHEHIVGLERDGERITIEPGGQFEFSGAARDTAAACRDALVAHVREVAGGGAPARHPLPGRRARGRSARSTTSTGCPKRRYDVMRDYFPRHGDGSPFRLAHHMMKMTATVQANFDYESESDAVDKIRTAYGVTSIVTALFAASPFVEGRPTGDKSFRAADLAGDRRGSLRAAAVRVRAGLLVSATTSSGRWTCPMFFVRGATARGRTRPVDAR